MVKKNPSEAPSNPIEVSLAYSAAHESAAVLRRRGRRLLLVEGRDPRAMLTGVLSGRIPSPLEPLAEDWHGGVAPYSTVLTPKGRMVTDLRLIPGYGGEFLLDLPEVGLDLALPHFKKYINPRFAELFDVSKDFGMLTVVGPEAPARVSAVLGITLGQPEPDEVKRRSGGSGPDLWVLGNHEVDPPAMDILLPMQILEQVRGQMEENGICSLDRGSWEVLRIEAGTPLFGVDMTEETIPVEVGIHTRAIDFEKGCYTGQEVIIRLRDRGQVNKNLRRISLGDSEVPDGGMELFASSEGSAGRSVGWVTSACRSPRFNQTIALAMVKRGVQEGQEVFLGGLGGPSGTVVALESPPA